MCAITVNVDNFARAESDRMFASVLKDSGGINEWVHNREPTPLDHQPVIRQNRDTLYSAVVADISGGATLTLPDAGNRYMSAMPVNQDHYVNDVFHDAGRHELNVERFGTPYVLIAVRMLVDPGDPADVAAVNALQDRLELTAGSSKPFDPPEYDEGSLTATRKPLLELARGLDGFAGAFGPAERVDRVRHLIASAAAWAGCPRKRPSTSTSIRDCRSANTA